MRESTARASGTSPAAPVGYGRLVPLRSEHRVKRVRALPPALLRVNAMPVTLAEFEAAAADWPVVFVAAQERSAPPVASIVLGLAPGENVALGADGGWRSGIYAPDHLRRYPFVLAAVDGDSTQRVVCVDAVALAGSSADDALAVTDADGRPTPQWDDTLRWLQQYDAALVHIAQLSAELHRRGLLEPMAVTLTVAGAAVQVDGLLRVDAAALGQLTDAELAGLVRSGVMRAVDAHLLSLHRFNALAQQLTARKGH